jgi:hypothetical protein
MRDRWLADACIVLGNMGTASASLTGITFT